MLDSGDNTTEQLNDSQPADVVATDAEATEGAPQPEATETIEIELGGEAASEEEAKSEDTDWKAVAHQERDKRKRKNAIIEQQAEELAAFKKKLERIENQVSDNGSFINEQQVKQHQSRAPKAADFTDDYGELDEKAYYKAVSEHSASAPQVKAPEPEPQPQVPQGDPEFMASEQALSREYANYNSDKAKAIESLMLSPEHQASLEAGAKDEGIDMRRFYITIANKPEQAQTFINAVNTGSGRKIREAMQSIESMTTLKQKKPIQSTPEPEIHSSGPVDNTQAAIDKAFDKWVETKSIADYKAYTKLKNQKNKG